MFMGKKNGIPKSRIKKIYNPCRCYYCTGTSRSEWFKLKYRWTKQAITDAINDL